MAVPQVRWMVYFMVYVREPPHLIALFQETSKWGFEEDKIQELEEKIAAFYGDRRVKY